MTATQTTVDYSRYYRYDEMVAALQSLEAAFPEFMTLASIGRSRRGRDLWLATISNQASGSDRDRPAFWIDANIHAEEVIGTMVCLYTIEHLLTLYGKDQRITRLLDTQAFYILPRMNPDAAEQCLTSPYPWCGNGRRAPEEVQTRGLRLHDLNGDGHITMMRVPDPLGEWKVSAMDPRLMIQRGPDEYNPSVQYYRLLPEGEIPDFDGAEIVIDPPNDGNMNRNFPANFLPEALQYGAGSYPLEEPEVRAVVEFIVDHPNIAGAQSYHTHGGVHLRPYLNHPDSEFPGDDLATYEAIGALGTEETGYPVISVYEEFTTDKGSPRTGSFMEWAYEQLGIITFSTEVWDIWRVAGVVEEDYFRFKSFNEEEKIKLLHWIDENVPGGYVDWQPFDHPQLGRLDIGGWMNIWTFRNPPGHLIEHECRNNFWFTMRHAACAPQLGMPSASARFLGSGLFKISAIVENRGYLPTNVSTQAIEKKVATEVVAEIALPEGTEVVMGDREQALGHLSGRSERRSEWSPWGNRWGSPRRRADWIVRGKPGAEITISVRSDKAGTVLETLSLPGW